MKKLKNMYKRAVQFCTGICKILTRECANIHSMKYDSTEKGN